MHQEKQIIEDGKIFKVFYNTLNTTYSLTN